jgi:hypothetical protein
MNRHAYINGERRRDLEKLTPAMWRMLRDLLDGTNSLHGRSEHGGATWTRVALRKRGLMQGGELTAAGREACAVEWRSPASKAANGWRRGEPSEEGVYLRASDDTEEDSDAEEFHFIGGKWHKNGKPWVCYGGVWKRKSDLPGEKK